MGYFITQLGEDIFNKKYAGVFSGKPEKFFSNVAMHLSNGDPLLEEDISTLMSERRFCPGGRILAFSGRDTAKVSLMNCTTHAIAGDTLQDIADTVSVVMQASSRGQGIGINLSNLRPKDAAVDNAAETSTGAVSFMEMIDKVGATIGQEGRRAAMLFALDISHPDIWRPTAQDIKCPHCNGRGCDSCDFSGTTSYDFLHVKKIPGHIENANISVLISDKFMRAVEDGADWEFKFDGISGGKPFDVSSTVKATDLFTTIAASAYNAAEPGVLFSDTIKSMSNSDVVGFPVVGCNACQPGFAPLLTMEGIRCMDDIEVGDFVMCADGWARVEKKWSTGIKPVYHYVTTNGEFIGTRDHKVFQRGERVEACQADAIDQLVPNVFNGVATMVSSQDVADGYVLFLGKLGSPEAYAPCEDGSVVGSCASGYMQFSKVAGLDFGDVTATTITVNEVADRCIPARFFYGSYSKKIGFLRGAFERSGFISGNGIYFTTHADGKVLDIQQILSSVGVRATVRRDSEWNGASTDLVLHICEESVEQFSSTIGSMSASKKESLAACTRGNTETRVPCEILTSELMGIYPVYDITVASETHAYWTGGLKVSNCSEMMLDQDGVCNLGSINLGAFVRNSYSDDATIDYCDLSRAVRTGIAALDNVVTIELEQKRYITDAQRLSNESLRRVGLGVMGLADMLVKLGLSYKCCAETDDAVRGLFEFIRNSAYRASIDLAKKRGPAPVFCVEKSKRERIVEQGFYATLPEDIKASIIEYGLRNVTLLSIAPTGSISNLLGISSGIEPIFAKSYTRRIQMYGNDRFVECVHPGVLETRELGISDDVWETAYDVSPSDHVWMQAVIQQYVDSSIAKTTNLPASATIQDVADIYMQAWKMGLKGITVYVDNSRSEQVLYVNDKSGNEADTCPSCGGDHVVSHGGCRECLDCGWGRCSI